MAKKNQRSRRSEFRSQQRKSWARFLLKIVAFAIPVVLGTLFVIPFLFFGNQVPLVYLGFDAVDSDAIKNKPNLQQLQSKPLHLKNFGGLDKQSMFVFSKILADARTAIKFSNDRDNDPDHGEESVKGDSSGKLRPMVFDPNEAEFVIHSWDGLLNPETNEQDNQWVSFGDYVEQIVTGVLDESLRDRPGRIVLVLDVLHPDLPGALPPHANQFVELVQQDWKLGRVQQRVNALFPKLDLAIWLSHQPGQHSYLAPDPARVGTFFQQRFESGWLGAANPSGPQTLTYVQLKDYVKAWVLTDSLHNKVAQQPLFLESENFPKDFPLYRQQPQDKKLFLYPQRSNHDLDGWWVRFDRISKKYDWELENPLALQRANLLLIQLERLWYVGRYDSTLSKNLQDELELVLTSNNAIYPATHSLYHRQRDATRMSDSPSLEEFDLKWLDIDDVATAGEPAASEPSTALSGDAEAIENKTPDPLPAWLKENANWRGTLAVWEAIVQAESGEITKARLEKCYQSLSPDHKRVPADETVSESDQRKIDWSEITYLQRLVGAGQESEFIWPTNSNGASSEVFSKVERLVHRSLQIRSAANQLAASFSPILVKKFRVKFDSLENERRMLEDRLFAHDHSKLEDQQTRLQNEYANLDKQHTRLTTAVRQLHKNLVTAPHFFRYCLESQFVLAQKKTIDHKVRTSAQQNYITAWNRLGTIIIGQQIDQESQRIEQANQEYQTASQQLIDDDELEPSLASSPTLDTNLIAGNDASRADGNLLFHRLLTWPELTIEQRKKMHEGLSKLTVEPSKKKLDWPLQTYQFATKDVGDMTVRGLVPILSGTQLLGAEPEGIESLTRAAFLAHVGWVQQNDDATTVVEETLNHAHAAKSRLDFSRLADDNWGTPAADHGTPYVDVVLTNHRALIESASKRFGASDLWKQDLQTWQRTIDERQQFSNSFRQPSRWNRDAAETKWLKNDAQSVQQFVRNQFLAGDKSVLRIMTPALTILPAIYDDHDNVRAWTNSALPPGSLQLYLRGHRCNCEVIKAFVAKDIEPLSIQLAGHAMDGAKIDLVRAAENEIAGQISFVIDCSGSMNTKGKMKRLKSNLIGFLREICGRSDIKVSMYAIGASSTKTGVNAKLDRWTPLGKSHADDVSKFNRNGEVLHEKNLDDFQAAVKELIGNRQTPLLRGLKLALDDRGAHPTLIVLLTDGFEYTTNDDFTLIQDFDLEMYRTIQQQIALKRGIEMAEFDFFGTNIATDFPDEAKNIRGGVAEIERRISAIHQLTVARLIKTEDQDSPETSLGKFLTALLPVPSVVLTSDQPNWMKDEKIDLAGNGQALQDQSKVIANFGIGLDTDKPILAGWSLQVRFDQSGNSSASEIFSRPETKWRSETGLIGNEVLQFVYDPIPITPTLDLVSKQPAGKTITLDGRSAMIKSSTQDRTRQATFELVAKEKNQLTPVPAFGFLTLENNTGNPKLLLQDFNLQTQTRSNVHPLEFAPYNQQLNEILFANQTINKKLWLLDQVPPDFWTKLTLKPSGRSNSAANEWIIANAGNKSMTLNTGFQSLEGLISSTPAAASYEIEIKREEVSDFKIAYSVRISAKPGKAVELDRWFVQLINGEDGSRNYQLNRDATRSYHFRNETQGKRLIDIEHRLEVLRDEFGRTAPIILGISHYDQLPFEKLESLPIDE